MGSNQSNCVFWGFELEYTKSDHLLPKHGQYVGEGCQCLDGHVSIGQRVGFRSLEFYAIFCGWLLFAAVFASFFKIHFFLNTESSSCFSPFKSTENTVVSTACLLMIVLYFPMFRKVVKSPNSLFCITTPQGVPKMICNL